MKTITSTETIKIKVKKEELLEGKWIHFQLLSKKLGEIEKENIYMRYRGLNGILSINNS